MRSSDEGGGRTLPPSMSARASRKIHGLPCAPRATITASQPVRSSIAFASAAVKTSPLPITGTLTAAFTCAITSQSAAPW